jgi:hypothetical protein
MWEECTRNTWSAQNSFHDPAMLSSVIKLKCRLKLECTKLQLTNRKNCQIWFCVRIYLTFQIKSIKIDKSQCKYSKINQQNGINWHIPEKRIGLQSAWKQNCFCMIWLTFLCTICKGFSIDSYVAILLYRICLFVTI